MSLIRVGDGLQEALLTIESIAKRRQYGRELRPECILKDVL